VWKIRSRCVAIERMKKNNTVTFLSSRMTACIYYKFRVITIRYNMLGKHSDIPLCMHICIIWLWVNDSIKVGLHDVGNLPLKYSIVCGVYVWPDYEYVQNNLRWPTKVSHWTELYLASISVGHSIARRKYLTLKQRL